MAMSARERIRGCVWLLVCLSLPLFGGGCATFSEQARPADPALPAQAGPSLLQARAHALLATRPGENAFRPLASGIDALLARLLLAQTAERSLDLQYYIWRDDLTGRQLTHALLAAADRGVRVRVLLDDVGASPDDATLLALAAHPRVAIRLFNPVGLRSLRGLGLIADFERTNRRMHNKAFIADGAIAVLGGRNIGDEYFEASTELSFGDLDVLSLGPVLPEIETAFEQFWQSPAAVPIQAIAGRQAERAQLDALRSELDDFVAAQRDSRYVQSATLSLSKALAGEREPYYWGAGHLLYDSPDKVSQSPADMAGTLLTQFAGVVASPEKELLLVSPYFVPGARGVAWFRQLRERGVRVTILTNSLAASDVGAVHSGYQRYREDLLKAGVRLYEMRPGVAAQRRHAHPGIGSSRASLHAKTFVFDRQAVFIGSLNFDPRSVRLNTEIGLLCDSPALARDIVDGLEAELDKVAWRLEWVRDAQGQGRMMWIEQGAQGERRYDSEPGVGILRQIGIWFLGLLPIESQL